MVEDIVAVVTGEGGVEAAGLQTLPGGNSASAIPSLSAPRTVSSKASRLGGQSSKDNTTYAERFGPL